MKKVVQLGCALVLGWASLATWALPPGNRERRRPAPPASPAATGAHAPGADTTERGNTPTAQQSGGLRERLAGKSDSGANAEAVRDKLGAQMSGTQQANLKQLQSDLAGIHQGSTVSQQQVQRLAADLSGCAQGATKPSQQSVQSLSSDLQSALADGNLSVREKAQLSEDVAAVLSSASISQAEAQAVIQDAQSILASSGVSQAEVQAVVGDLQAIATELQANVPR